MLKTFEDRYVGLEQEVLCEDCSSFSQKLQTIYESVVDAPATMGPEEIRHQSCEAFVELFEGTDRLRFGEGHLPEEPGHIFIMNHLSNHPANLLPNGFIPTLDTHFVSSIILLKKYGEAPVRVVRRSNPDEDTHRRFYDRLGYIYVYSRCMNPAEYGSSTTPEERRRLFLDVGREHLKDGRNIVICPEGKNRVLPADWIPRIIPRVHWEKLSAGLLQRGRAINAWLVDLYNGDQDVVPEEIIQSSVFYRTHSWPDCSVPTPIQVYGPDVVHYRTWCITTRAACGVCSLKSTSLFSE